MPIPDNFILTVDNYIPPLLSYSYTTETYYQVSSTLGVRSDTQTSFLNKILLSSSIFPYRDYSEYLHYYLFLGQPSIYCIWDQFSFIQSPFTDAESAIPVGNGTVSGQNAVIFVGDEYWWYSYKSAIGVYEPVAWVNYKGEISVVRDFSLQKPSPVDFDEANCFPGNGFIGTAEMSKKRSAIPPQITFPGTFTMTLTDTFKSMSYYIDLAHNRSAVDTMVNYYSPKYPQFIEHKIKQNGKLYSWIEWGNIPMPCFYQPSPNSGGLWDQPNLTPLGSLQSDFYGNLNLYTSGININYVWFYNAQSQPLGLLDLSKRDPAGPATVSNYQPATPDPSHFTVPPLCFPLVNGTFSSPSQRREVNAIGFPTAFSMSYTGLLSNYKISTRSFYYDDATSPTTNLRIDYEGYTVLQIDDVVYYYVTNDDIDIDPLPCTIFENEPPVWQSPTFSRLVANVTINGKINGVYSAFDYPFNNLLQYWYFQSTDGTPQYFRNGEFILAQVTYFQPSPPPPGFFDIPVQCNTAIRSKRNLTF